MVSYFAFLFYAVGFKIRPINRFPVPSSLNPTPFRDLMVLDTSKRRATWAVYVGPGGYMKVMNACFTGPNNIFELFLS